MAEQPPFSQPPEGHYQPQPGYSGPPPGAYPAGPPPGGYPPTPGGYPPYQYGPQPPMPRSSGIPWWGWLLGGCLLIVVVGGVFCGILGATLGARLGTLISRVANEQFVSDTSSQTFTVTGAPSIVVDDPAGNITYQVAAGNVVVVQIIRRAGDSSTVSAQNDLQSISASATQSGDSITIHADVGSSQGFGQTKAVDLSITGPANATFNLTDQAGNINITGTQGLISTDVQTGNVTLSGVTLADGSQLKTNVGTVTVRGQLASGASADINVSVGTVTVTLPSSTSTHLSATADTGDVSIVGWTVQQTANGAGHTASGDLGSAPSGTLTVHVGTGNITVSQG